MKVSNKLVNRILARAIEILKEFGWCKRQTRRLKDRWFWKEASTSPPEYFNYCILGAITQAVSEKFKIPFDAINPYFNREGACLLYGWNDGLGEFLNHRYDREGKVPPRVLRALRKAMTL